MRLKRLLLTFGILVCMIGCGEHDIDNVSDPAGVSPSDAENTAYVYQCRNFVGSESIPITFVNILFALQDTDGTVYVLDDEREPFGGNRFYMSRSDTLLDLHSGAFKYDQEYSNEITGAFYKAFVAKKAYIYYTTGDAGLNQKAFYCDIQSEEGKTVAELLNKANDNWNRICAIADSATAVCHFLTVFKRELLQNYVVLQNYPPRTLIQYIVRLEDGRFLVIAKRDHYDYDKQPSLYFGFPQAMELVEKYQSAMHINAQDPTQIWFTTSRGEAVQVYLSGLYYKWPKEYDRIWIDSTIRHPDLLDFSMIPIHTEVDNQFPEKQFGWN